MSIALQVEPHPLLHARAFATRLPAPLGEVASPAWLTELLALQADAPLSPDDAVKKTVRDLLRHGGFKPSGRSKPASEYLVRTASGDGLRSINAVVDTCNVVSLHSGIPISVVDLQRARPPFRLAVGEPETRYVFNPSGQIIDVSGLLCLFDAEGPCANAVKDAQRTKTDATTTETLSVLWGPLSLAERVDGATAWYRELLERLGATTEPAALGEP